MIYYSEPQFVGHISSVTDQPKDYQKSRIAACGCQEIFIQISLLPKLMPQPGSFSASWRIGPELPLSL
jgi:hypothetical protein